MDSRTSERLTLLRFPLIVGVVFIHAANGTGLALSDTARAARPVESAISFGLAAVAVPLFFLVSGYLFFQLGDSSDGQPRPLGVEAYARKLRRRVRTLLIPYLFWNVLLAAVYFAASRVPRLEGLMSGAQAAFVHEGPLGWLAAILGIGTNPVVYQFWFLRNLMLAILLVPLFEGIFRVLGKPSSLALGVLAVGVPWAIHRWPMETPNAVSLFFFFLGAWAGRFRLSLFALDAAAPVTGVLWLVTVGVCTLGLAGEVYPYLLQLSIALGIVFVLGATARGPLAPGRLDGPVPRALVRWAPSAFFLFAVHEPLLTAVIRLSTRLLGMLGAGQLPSLAPIIELCLYFGSVALVCALSVALHRVARRVAPRVTSVATGGR